MISGPSELFAGDECGLFVLIEQGEAPQWRPLLEDAEARGLSGILTTEASDLAPFAALGVEHVSLVCGPGRLADALLLAGRGGLSSLCLVSPLLPDDPALVQRVSALRLPRLLLSGSAGPDVEATRRFDAASAGAVAMRFLPATSRGAGLFADPSTLAAESVCLFALRNVNATLQRHPHPGLAA